MRAPGHRLMAPKRTRSSQRPAPSLVLPHCAVSGATGGGSSTTATTRDLGGGAFSGSGGSGAGGGPTGAGFAG
jgi:uncharacterized membrane protein YgcG